MILFAITSTHFERSQMSLRTTILRSLLVVTVGTCIMSASAEPTTSTVKGYVLDSACAFTKNLEKPISKDCALSCAKAGSHLVILTDSGQVYWPISDAMPAIGQNERLLPFAAQKVTVTGRVYVRGGSRAIVIDKVEPQAAAK
jgi:hypothetical protein